MSQYGSADWMGREYAVETFYSLTATEESDRYFMTMENMLRTLAPFDEGIRNVLASPRGQLMPVLL